MSYVRAGIGGHLGRHLLEGVMLQVEGLQKLQVFHYSLAYCTIMAVLKEGVFVLHALCAVIWLLRVVVHNHNSRVDQTC